MTFFDRYINSSHTGCVQKSGICGLLTGFRPRIEWPSTPRDSVQTPVRPPKAPLSAAIVRSHGKSLDELINQDIVAYLHSHERRGGSRRTVNSWLLILRSFLRWAIDQELIAPKIREQIPRKIKYDKTAPVTATAEEVDLLLRYGGMQSCYRLALLLMFEAGLRVSEAIGLRWSDVNLEARTISVPGKGHKRRLLPIVSERLYERLLQASRVGTRPQWPVVWTDHASREHDQPLAAESVRRSLRAAQQTARIKRKLTPHNFRHGFAARVAKAGINAKFIQQALGHASLATTDDYLASLVGDLDGLREALAQI